MIDGFFTAVAYYYDYNYDYDLILLFNVLFTMKLRLIFLWSPSLLSVPVIRDLLKKKRIERVEFGRGSCFPC